MKENILGYPVAIAPIDLCVEHIVKVLQEEDGFSWLACMNPHGYTVALKDDRFARALKNANWLVPDGIGIVLASWIFGGAIRSRVTGSDVFEGVSARMNSIGGMSVYFLGSNEETLGIIQDMMARDFPCVRVAGVYSPPFKTEFSQKDIDTMVDTVNSALPDVLWVGMTAPKQEIFIFQNRKRLKVKFAGAIGAVFDFYSGQVKRSPLIFRSVGLEWLPRLIGEPRRLWRRMLVSAPVFLWHLFIARFWGKR